MPSDKKLNFTRDPRISTTDFETFICDNPEMANPITISTNHDLSKQSKIVLTAGPQEQS